MDGRGQVTLCRDDQTLAGVPPCFWHLVLLGACISPVEWDIQLRTHIRTAAASEPSTRWNLFTCPLLGFFSMPMRQAKSQSCTELESRPSGSQTCTLPPVGSRKPVGIVQTRPEGGRGKLLQDTCVFIYMDFMILWHLFDFLPDFLLFPSWWWCQQGILGNIGIVLYNLTKEEPGSYYQS